MRDDEKPLLDNLMQSTFTRRDVIKGAAKAGVIVAGLGPLLSACGGSSSTSSPSPSAASLPKTGGVLRAGLSGGSSSDSLDANNAVTEVDFARVANLYEPLVQYDPEAKIVPVLAEELTPNADATVWTVRLRSGVTFHNGKDLTADDVISSFQQILNPKKPGEGAALFQRVNVAGMKKLDAITVQIPCHAPFASLPEAAATVGCANIVPVGYDPKKAVGTGPFAVESFTPGQQSTFKRNPNYWQSGLPYVDQLVITDYADETSQSNALSGGQVDAINLLSATSISMLNSQGKKTLVSRGGGFTPFTMRVDIAPFNDVRVRQAMRLIVDRKQMLDAVFMGLGTLGNDIFSPWDPAFDTSIPQREQDIAQAKSLLKAAGREGLTVELVTADIAQGLVAAAQVFKQEATAAGVTVNLRKTTTTDFYGPGYLKYPFAQDYWYFTYYLAQVSQCFMKGAYFNETHFSTPRYTKLYLEAEKTVDDNERYEICHEMQQIDYNEGGYIIPYFPPVIDGYAPNVHGLVTSKEGVSLNDFLFKYLWLT